MSSNKQSTLKICFSETFLLKEQLFIFLFLKSQYYQNMAHYVQWNLPDQCSLPTLPLPTQILFSQKEKKLLSASSILFSVLQKAGDSEVLFLYLAEDLIASHHN